MECINVSNMIIVVKGNRIVVIRLTVKREVGKVKIYSVYEGHNLVPVKKVIRPILN